MMHNILLVFTGGTIGSTVSDGVIDTSGKQGYQLVELFQKEYPQSQDFNFKIIQPIQLLSENLVPDVWEKLIAAIEKQGVSQFDGIIVTHGTDTLAYTAAALSLYFNAIEIPLLLVSSGYPLEHPLANGLAHFICAIDFIKQRAEAGVFVPYKNNSSSTLIHLGCRLVSSLQLSSDFIGVQSKAYLQYAENSFTLLNNYEKNRCDNKPLLALFNSRVLLIRPYPGIDYSVFQMHQVDAVLHDLYHSGTACTTMEWGEYYCLKKFVRQCQQRKIPFYMAPAIKTDSLYQSTEKLIESGAKMIWNVSLEVAYVKLLLALGNFKDEDAVDQFLQQNIAFEQIESGKSH